MQFVLFELDGSLYGFNIEYVESIERKQPTTHVPGTAEFICGLINLRGVITPVIDGRAFFGRTPFSPDQPSRTIVLAHDSIRVGFMVDGTRNVVDVDRADIQPVPEDIESGERVQLSGVVYHEGKTIGLLNVEPVLDSSTAIV